MGGSNTGLARFGRRAGFSVTGRCLCCCLTVSASQLLFCFRRNSVLQRRLLRGSRFRVVLLQVHPGRFLVGRSYHDYGGLW
jgi:hypothetical protein